MHTNGNTTPTTQHVERVVRRVGQSCLCCVPIHTNSPRFFLIFQPSLCSKSSISSRTSVRCARRLRWSPSTMVLRMLRACCTSEILCHREAEVRKCKNRVRHVGAHPQNGAQCVKHTSAFVSGAGNGWSIAAPRDSIRWTAVIRTHT